MLQLQHSATISRSVAVGTNGRNSKSVVGTADCLALPLDPRSAVQNGFTVGKGWEVFFDESTDVRVNDKLVVNSNTYTVSGVMDYQVALVAHKRALCNQESV